MIEVERKVEVGENGVISIPRMSKILVVLRNDVDHFRTVNYIINLASSMIDPKIRILYTVDIEPIPLHEETEMKFYGKLRREGEEIVRNAMDKIKDAGIDVELHDMHFGIAAERILKAERELDPDLIVMGARGLSTFKKMLLGSISDEVSRKAKAPVLIVR
jgi:nucleotide-binding universal stress UspA family protein